MTWVLPTFSEIFLAIASKLQLLAPIVRQGQVVEKRYEWWWNQAIVVNRLPLAD